MMIKPRKMRSLLPLLDSQLHLSSMGNIFAVLLWYQEYSRIKASVESIETHGKQKQLLGPMELRIGMTQLIPNCNFHPFLLQMSRYPLVVTILSWWTALDQLYGWKHISVTKNRPEAWNNHVFTACVQLCHSLSRRVSAVRAGEECFCLAEMPHSTLVMAEDGACSTPCKADQNHFCGGEVALQIFVASKGKMNL